MTHPSGLTDSIGPGCGAASSIKGYRRTAAITASSNRSHFMTWLRFGVCVCVCRVLVGCPSSGCVVFCCCLFVVVVGGGALQAFLPLTPVPCRDPAGAAVYLSIYLQPATVINTHNQQHDACMQVKERCCCCRQPCSSSSSSTCMRAAKINTCDTCVTAPVQLPERDSS
jgi:hypothetical protein